MFVLAGAGVTLIAHPAIGRTRAGWVRLMGTGATWVILFALGYFLIYQGTANSDYMQSIWSGSFLTLPLHNLAGVANGASRTMWIETLFGENDAMLPRKMIASVAALSAVGAVVLLRRRGLLVALLVLLPFVATAGASFARLWPLTPRLLVFLVPAIILLVGAGLWALVSLLPVRARGFALGLVGALYLVPAGIYDAQTLRTPKRRDDIAPLVREFMANRTDSAIMYVMGHGTPSWLFYTARWKERDGAAFRLAAARANTATHFQTRGCITQEPGLRVAFGPTGTDVFTDSSLAGEAAWLAAQPERDVWLLTLSYEHAAGHVMERKLVEQGATRVQERSRQGAELRHFRFGAAPTTGTGASCETPVVASPA